MKYCVKLGSFSFITILDYINFVNIFLSYSIVKHPSGGLRHPIPGVKVNSVSIQKLEQLTAILRISIINLNAYKLP